MKRQQFEVIERHSQDRKLEETIAKERVERLVALGQALSDPIRVWMLGLMSVATREGRGCCGLPDLGAPASAEEGSLGICVCEFEDYFGMGQSKVSYHLRKLKDAGLVQEEKRGKWSFYTLNQAVAQDLLLEIERHLFSAEQVAQA